MKRHDLSLLMVLAMTCGGIQAHAALDLELTQGMDAKLPVALQVTQNPTVAGGVAFSDVIQQDLNHSGQFLVKVWDAGMPNCQT